MCSFELRRKHTQTLSMSRWHCFDQRRSVLLLRSSYICWLFLFLFSRVNDVLTIELLLPVVVAHGNDDWTWTMDFVVASGYVREQHTSAFNARRTCMHAADNCNTAL